MIFTVYKTRVRARIRSRQKGSAPVPDGPRVVRPGAGEQGARLSGASVPVVTAGAGGRRGGGGAGGRRARRGGGGRGRGVRQTRDPRPPRAGLSGARSGGEGGAGSRRAGDSPNSARPASAKDRKSPPQLHSPA